MNSINGDRVTMLLQSVSVSSHLRRVLTVVRVGTGAGAGGTFAASAAMRRERRRTTVDDIVDVSKV